MSKRIGYYTIGILGTLLLCFSLIVHLMTYVYINIHESYSMIGIFLFFLLFIGLSMMSGNMGFRIRFGEDVTKNANKTISTMGKIFGVYCIFNFVICLYLLEFGSPDVWDGVMVLQNRGAFIRNLTGDEYLHMKAYEMRLFTGFHVLVYLHLVWLVSGLLNNAFNIGESFNYK